MNKICKEMAEKLSLQVSPPELSDRGGALVAISQDRGSMGSDMIENSWIDPHKAHFPTNLSFRQCSVSDSTCWPVSGRFGLVMTKWTVSCNVNYCTVYRYISLCPTLMPDLKYLSVRYSRHIVIFYSNKSQYSIYIWRFQFFWVFLITV